MSNLTLDQLRARFGEMSGVRLESGPGGLIRVAIATPQVSGQVYLHGAHVSQWQPQGEAPVLWMSGSSRFEAGKPIRGGVPICFPWFGAKADDASAPGHGLARTHVWHASGIRQTADGEVVVELETLLLDYALTYTVTFGRSLTMTLHVRNGAATARRFEAALHTYLTVGDARQVRLSGLAGATYIDKVDGGHRKVQGAEPIMFTQETDRLYLNTTSACVLEDPVLLRRIRVEKSGSHATVVWNPWIAKSAAMEDFGDDEWPGMCCIETANANDNAVTLAPGEDHSMTAAIHVTRG